MGYVSLLLQDLQEPDAVLHSGSPADSHHDFQKNTSPIYGLKRLLIYLAFLSSGRVQPEIFGVFLVKSKMLVARRRQISWSFE
jgi:hypothetical protein